MLIAMVVIICGLVGIIGCTVFYKAGRMQGLKEGAVTANNVATILNGVIKQTGEHASKQSEIWVDVLKQKDAVIASYAKVNDDMREQLEAITAYDMDEDSEESDDEEEQVAVVVSKDKEHKTTSMLDSRTAASVALKLYDKLEAAKTVLSVNECGNLSAEDTIKQVRGIMEDDKL